MAITTIKITHPENANTMSDRISDSDGRTECRKIGKYMNGLASGVFRGSLDLQIAGGDAVAASKIVTLTDVVADDVLLINGVSFTAGSTFDIGLSDTITAANLVEAINECPLPLISGVVSASSEDNEVTISAVSAGFLGNLITLQSRGSAAIAIPGEGAAAEGTITCISVAAGNEAEVDGNVFTAVDKREKATITCIADTGVREIGEIVAVADTGEFEKTDLTCVADAGEFEITSVTSIADTSEFEVQTVTVPASAGYGAGDFFILTNTTGAKVAYWLNVGGDDVEPNGPIYSAADSKVAVTVLDLGTNIQNAAAVAAAWGSILNWTVSDNLNGTVTFTQTKVGPCADPVRYDEPETGNGSFGVATDNEGVAGLNNKYFTFSSMDSGGAAETDYYVWYNVSSSGTAPAPGGIGIAVAISSGATDSAVSAATRTAIGLSAADVTLSGSDPEIIITNDFMGAATDTTAGDSGFTVSKTNDGVASNLLNEYFTFQAGGPGGSGDDYYVWYNVNGEGVDPAGGSVGVEVAIAAGAINTAVASATRAVFLSDAGLLADFVESGATTHVIFENKLMGDCATTDELTTAFSNSQVKIGADSNLLNDYFIVHSANDAKKFIIWMNINGEGTQPVEASDYYVEVALAAGVADTVVSAAIKAKFDPSGDANLLTYFDTYPGAVAPAVRWKNKLVGVTTNAENGSVVDWNGDQIAPGADSNLNDTYFQFYSAADDKLYVMHYDVNGEGSVPGIGDVKLHVELDPSDNANTVASKSRALFLSDPDALADFVESGNNNKIVFQNVLTGVTTDATDSGMTGFTIATIVGADHIEGGVVGATEFQIDADDSVVASNLKDCIDACAELDGIARVSSIASNELTLRSDREGADGNAVTLSGTGGVNVSSGHLANGSDEGATRLEDGADASLNTFNFGV